mmetsp:Transcript_32875/g.51509  ORF Transcript_32875/g.51509 Transcript_32875/m.51509 type:complete len:249 (-) Transcript_32875:154-900(-)
MMIARDDPGESETKGCNRDDASTGDDSSSYSSIRGRALFCLVPDVSWFQGHFIQIDSEEPLQLGLLAVEQEVDDCIRCCHGNNLHSLTFINHKTKKRKTFKVEKSGGNFMELKSDQIQFITKTMKAEDEAVPILQKYFSPIVKALLLGHQKDGESQEKNQDPSSASTFEPLRNCVICIGDMDVSNPISLKRELGILPSHCSNSFAPPNKESVVQMMDHEGSDDDSDHCSSSRALGNIVQDEGEQISTS